MSHFSAIVETIVGTVRGRVQYAHDLAAKIKASGTTKADINSWIENSTDPEIVTKREKLAAVLAKVEEEKKQLEAQAEAALKADAPEDIDSVKEEFNTVKKEIRVALNSAKTTLGTLGVTETPEIDEMLANIPSVSNLPGSGVSGISPEKSAKIRAWGAENGFEVSERGRLKAELVEAYDKAHAA